MAGAGGAGGHPAGDRAAGQPARRPWSSLALGTSALAASALLGVTISTRRAYLAALEERARRAERERNQQAQLAASAERARIAREMHDIVAHNLAVMVALADGAAFTAPVAPTPCGRSRRPGGRR